MIGQTLSHYKILQKLGEGGMGVVYKAHDTKLDRIVALKFLPQQISLSDETKSRFLQEAKAISSLNHPNIATIYDIDEVDILADAAAPGHDRSGGTNVSPIGKQKFLVLEYIPGGTLKSRVNQLKSEDKEFSLSEVIEFAFQVAEALAHAHRRQIIHRDVKTDNLMLTDEGKVKLTDFGLAKLRGSGQTTRTGTTAGTAAYMSPEQIRGEEADFKSDIFSFGVVLYELVTSRLPFRGEFEIALSYSILNEDPPPVKSLRKETPPALEKIISRCLEKDGAQRYQSAEELVDALKEVQEEVSRSSVAQTRGRNIPLLVAGAMVVVAVIVAAYFFWFSRPTTPGGKSVAVLPFDDLSPLKDQEYFCMGITEELINRLSNIKDLRVPARTSTSIVKGRMDIKEIGEKLRVQAVLEGSVRRDSSKLRITAQLINVADGFHLWSQTYNRDVKDMFAIQDEISLAIVNALKLKLAPNEQVQITRRTIDNVQAYELHLRARYEMYLFTEKSLGRALQFIKSGLELAGENETLYGDMGQVYFLYHDMGIQKEESLLIKAEECIQKVFALNPESSYGHLLRANIFRRRGKAQEAVKEFKQSLAIDPNNPDAMVWLAWVYMHSGKPLASRPIVNKLFEIDPIGPVSLWGAGLQEVMEGRFENGLDAFGKAQQMEQDNPLFLYLRAKALAYAGKEEEAIKLFDTLAKNAPQTLWAILGSFFNAALQNKKAEALQYVTEELKVLARSDEFFPIWMAESYALMNEKNEAIDWLEHGIKWGFINYPFLVQHDRFLVKLHGEERFQKLMEQVKKQWEEFEV